MANSNTSTTELVAASPAPPATRLPSTTWQSGQNLATTDFQYEALPDPETYFRLLKINSIPHDSAWLPKVTRLLDFRAKREPAEAAAGQFVECDLTTWPIDSAPNYHAISYTWGEEQSPSRIKVGGKYMQVRRNCEYMLQQVFKHCGSETYIWVDAICINQNDNTEKNHQVYMMGSIYSRADRVLACIGNHDGDSQFLFRTLRREEKRLEEIGRASAINHEDYPLELMKLCSQRKPHQARINLRDPSRLSRAYKAIFQRLYFSRVWTVQELWVANSVVVLCGSDSLLAMSLLGFQNLPFCSPLQYFLSKQLRLLSPSYRDFPLSDHWILALIPFLDRLVPVRRWDRYHFLAYHLRAVEQGKINVYASSKPCAESGIYNVTIYEISFTVKLPL